MPPATQGVVVGPEVDLGTPFHRKPLHGSFSPSVAHALAEGGVLQQADCRFPTLACLRPPVALVVCAGAFRSREP